MSGDREMTLDALLIRFEEVIIYGYKPINEDMSDEDQYLSRQFFSKIYFDRPHHEKCIKDFCDKNLGSLGTVVGVQGSGKSTIIQKIRKDMDHPEQCPFLIIDFGTFYPQQLAREVNINNWGKIVEDYLKNNIGKRFLGEEGIDKHFFHFLYEHEDLNGVLGEVRGRLRRRFSNDMSMKGGKQDLSKAAEKKWFKKNQAHFVPIANLIAKKLNLAHFFQAARRETNEVIKRFIIVFDNVDRVPRYHQADIYQIAEDIRMAYSDFVHTIITTRKETCHPPGQVINYHPAPVTEIGIYNAQKEDEKNLTAQDFNQILGHRLQVFLSRSNNDPLARQLVTLSLSLQEGYSDIVLINLANQSIRDALHYHCKFVRYLLNEYPSLQELNQRLRMGGGSLLSSCLYGWVTKHEDAINQQCLNVVDLLDNCRKNNFVGIAGCDLSYLLLVCLYNDKHRGKYHLVRVSELFDRFNRLNYSNDKLREALFNLWATTDQEFGHILNIYQKNLPGAWTDIKDDAELELNYRGDRLIKEVTISFTFINRLLYNKSDDYFYPTRIRNDITHYYDFKHLANHARWSCKFLYRLAFLHSLELHKIRSRYNCNRWTVEYAKDFCINGEFQLIRIIDNHMKFLKKAIDHHAGNEGAEWKNKVEEAITIMDSLQNIYKRQIALLTPETREEKWVFDFETILGKLWVGSITSSDVERVCNDGGYRKDIANLL